MGPRKKSKPELNQPSAEQLETASVQTDVAAVPQSQPPASSEAPGPQRSLDSSSASIAVPKNTASRSPSLGELKSGWYGSWKQKAKPVTEVARESIAANAPPRAVTVVAGSPPTPSKPPKQASENIATPSPKRYLSGTAKSAKGTPILATTTNISITSSRKLEPSVLLDPPPPKDGSQASINDSQSSLHPDSQPIPPDPLPEVEKLPDRPSTPSGGGWFSGWWSRPDGYAESVKKQSQTIPKEAVLDVAKAMSMPDIGPSPAPEQPPALSAVANGNAHQEGDKKLEPAPTIAPDQSKGWFGIWSKSQNTAPSSRPHDGQPAGESMQAENRPPTVDQPQQADSNASVKDGRDGSRRNASGWAFWSTEAKSTDGKSGKQVGELAVANTPSQDRPEAAQFNEVETPISKEPAKPASRKAKPGSSTLASNQAPSKALTQSQVATSESSKQVRPDPSQKNLILPEFSKTYSVFQQPSIWQQLRQYFVAGEAQTPHLHISPNPGRVKKALAIGIHGFFPAPIVQKLLGPPTGTSIKFANNAATAIKAWSEEHGFECEIEKVALEGEGLISDRVDTLWRLLLNWMDHIRSTDLILIACHSQGVPVSVMLVERLINFKCIAPGTKIGICAMAGVNLGPFPEYKTQLFGRSASELFDFTNPKSKVSMLYTAALEEILKNGVKVVFVGSMDDQLVSLEVNTSLSNTPSNATSRQHFPTFLILASTAPHLWMADYSSRICKFPNV
jgi:hypothetical protein